MAQVPRDRLPGRITAAWPCLNSLDIEGKPSDTRVVVAMSGGVESSVTAALLSDAGYDVVGITLQLYDDGAATHRKGACCAGRDIHDARAVAERIGIPHYVLDYESRFKEAVIDRFAESYVAGEIFGAVPGMQPIDQVPRPFGNRARPWRQDFGHRSLRRLAGAAGRRPRALSRPRGRTRPELFFVRHHARPARPAALSTRRPEQGETRDLARRFGLPVAAQAHDSQDICFVPTGHYAEVIERLRPEAAAPGEIVDLDGRVLGRHDGVIHFTVGQRRGLGVATGAPLYVVRLDAASRRVVVGPREALRTSRIRLREVNWLGDATIQQALERRPEVFAPASSTRPPQPAWLRAGADGAIEVELIASEDGVAPGQACAFYDAAEGQARVLGGGIIASTMAAASVQRALRADLAAAH